MFIQIRKGSWWVAVLALFLVAATPGKQVVWERIDVNLTINPDGTVDVEEQWRITFEGGPFRYGYRRIETRYLTDITDVQVLDEEGPYRPGTAEAPRVFVLESSSQALTIRWFFEPLSDTTRTFILRYRVHGALRFYEGGEQFWWKAVFPDRDAPVHEATVTVRAPGPIRAAQAYFVPAKVQRVDASTVRFIAEKQIPAGTSFEVRVEWLAGVVGGTPAPWQAQADAEARALERQAVWEQRWRPIVEVLVVMGSLTVLIVGALGLYLLWYTRGRDPYVEVFAEYLTEPPSDLPPAIAGVVVDERANIKEILATLLDLGRRGFLEIFELPGDYRFQLTGQSVALRPFERVLVERLFRGHGVRRLSDWKYLLGTADGKAVLDAIYEEAQRLGFFPHHPRRVRVRYQVLGIVISVLSGVVLFPLGGFLASRLSSFWCPGAAVSLLGALMMVMGTFMPRKTRKGAEEAAKWRAFKRYLEKLERMDVAQAETLLERYLPYAVALGVEDRFLKALEKWEQRTGRSVPIPGWYHTPHTPTPRTSGGAGRTAAPGRTPSLSEASRSLGAGLSGLSQSLGGMLSLAATTLAPASSSSGGGFSGGGSFGGGGGGGGGGGFG